MNEEEAEDHGHLPRLPESAYQGKVVVHWSFTVHQRRLGWLSPSFHDTFRWVLLHGCARYEMGCLIYCLMPDHIHLLVAGWTNEADQMLFVRFVRRHLNPLLLQAGVEGQKQPYDHVLRKDDRDRYGVESVAGYIAENPVKAGLVTLRQEWPFTGSVLPGYPELHPHMKDYWFRYWRIRASFQK
ncbi:MAG: hypothetical protein JWO08_1332 [Verrucomicrobiaceae bacterium]|nr:hypothetical protein [Verrucomicrobiaceae bacterium]